MLRTTDAIAARAFYAEAIGLRLPDGMATGSALEAWPLHERALARGAPPHWLGPLAVDDVQAVADRLVGLGSEPLGPTLRAQDGTPFAMLRDPFGSLIGIRARGGSANSPVVWHQLHTRDVDGAWALYHELFGWTHKQTRLVPCEDPQGAAFGLAQRRLIASTARGSPSSKLSASTLRCRRPDWHAGC